MTNNYSECIVKSRHNPLFCQASQLKINFHHSCIPELGTGQGNPALSCPVPCQISSEILLCHIHLVSARRNTSELSKTSNDAIHWYLDVSWLIRVSYIDTKYFEIHYCFKLLLVNITLVVDRFLFSSCELSIAILSNFTSRIPWIINFWIREVPNTRSNRT